MALKTREQLLLAKVESAYGTDSTPTGAANAILTGPVSVTPLAGPTVSRNTVKSYLGADLQIQTGQFVEISFPVEIAGGGAAGTAPGYSVLMQGCGFDETVNAATSVVFSPNSDSAESLTLYFWQAGQLHKVTGARGTFTMSLSPGEIPVYNFSFTGLYNAPSTTTEDTPDYTAFQTPVPINNANTGTFSLHSVSASMVSFSLDIGNQVVYRNVVGNESVEITNRAVSGSCTIEAPTITAKDWFTTALNSTTGALQMVHGGTAGNIVTIDAPAAQVISPSYGDSDGIVTLEANLSLVPASGDDEITITLT